MKCEQRIWTGPRKGALCRNTATAIVVSEAKMVCGTHARAWLDRGLARIAYYDERTRSWP